MPPKGVDRGALADVNTKISTLGFDSHSKPVMVVGNSLETLSAVKKAEATALRRQEARAKTKMQNKRKRPTVPRQSPYCFQKLEPLPNFEGHHPSTSEARELLHRLSTDPGILAIMELHQWTVGCLKEFAPSLETGIVGVTDGCLLGYNQNKGQVIALRLRTGQSSHCVTDPNTCFR